MDYKEFFSKYRYNRKTDLIANTRFGTVYLAQSTKRDLQVYLRVMPVSDTDTAATLKSEADFVDSLPANPYIVRYQRVYRFEEATGDIDVAVMPYFPLGSLEKVLEDWKLDNEERRGLRDRILDAAAFLRANGVNLGIFDPATVYVTEEEGELIPHLTDLSGVAENNPQYDEEVCNLLPVEESSAAPEENTEQENPDNGEVYPGESDADTEPESEEESFAEALEETDEEADETRHGRWIYVVGVIFTWIAVFVLIFVLHRRNNPSRDIETTDAPVQQEQPAEASKTSQEVMRDSLRADSLSRAAAAAAEQARIDSIKLSKQKAKEEKAKKADNAEAHPGDWTDSKKMTPEEEAAYNEKARREETSTPATAPEPAPEL